MRTMPPRAPALSSSLLLAGLLVAMPGCQKEGATQGSTAPAADGKSKDGPHHASHTHGEIANSSVVADMHAEPAPNTSGLLKSTHAKTNSYDVNAPATVLVTTRWGHGSGVIIDPKGLVLTNYHVVESGETEDFGIEVGITTAKINPDGSADPDKKLRARALKIDAKRDIALLQVVDLEGELPAAPLAPADRPRAGRKVSAIGNAGVGFGWAVKHCHINAVGTMESAAMAIFQKEAEALPPEMREQMAEAVKKAALDAGLQIQTDCSVLPGDSGGPLIDEETHELVGLNAAIRTSTSGIHSLGSVSFHVHIKEIRQFMESVPKEPQQFLPDPWELAGHQAAIDDTNKDGEVDSLRVGGRCGSQHMICHGIFVDTDQDSFHEVDTLPPLQEVYEKRSFDPEFAVFARARYPRGGQVGDHLGPLTDMLLYFDSNNDGAFDGLLVRDSEAREIRGYRVAGEGLKRDKGLDGVEDPRHLFEQAGDRERFVKFKTAFDEGTHATQVERTVPVEVKVDDLSGDGTLDTAKVQTRLDERTVVDVDQDSLPTLDAAGVEAALADGKIDAELIAITSSPYRIWYDRDNDGRVDLMLEGDNPDRGFALDAANIDADGKRTPAPEHVGRRLLRPGLYADPAIAEATDKVLGAAFPQPHAEIDDALSTFPSTTLAPFFDAREYDDTNRGAVAVAEPGRVILMFDLDRNTFKKKGNKSKELAEVLREGAYDAEFIFMFDGELSWSFYDVNNDGKFDQVWVGANPNPQTPRQVFTLGKTTTHAAPESGTTMFEPSVFKKKKKLKKSFEKLRKEVVAF